MGRLLPSHPLSLHAPLEVRERIDVMGQHLLWTGAMAGRSRGKRTRHALVSYDGHTGVSVNRLVWAWTTGNDLAEDELLVRKDSCPHERCVAPGCFVKMSRREAASVGGVRRQGGTRAVS